MTALPDTGIDQSTVAGLLAARVRLTPDAPAARYWHAGDWHTDSWRTLAARVRAVADALGERGMGAGATLGLFLPTSYAFVLADFAAFRRCWRIACYHPAWQADELRHAFLLTRPNLVLVAQNRIACVEKAIADAGLKTAVWVALDEDGVSFSSSFAAASAPRDGDEADDAPIEAAGLPGQSRFSTTTIGFTSGTDEGAKGVILSEQALVRVAVRAFREVGYRRRHAATLHWLPLAHLFGRLGPLLDIVAGSTGSYGRGAEHLADDIAAARPHALMAVPQFLDRARRAIEAHASARGSLRALAFRGGIAIGRCIAALPPRVRIPLQTRLRRSLFRAAHARFGGRLELLIVGGAPVPLADVAFFEAIGIPVRVGFGMTETAGVASIQPYRRRSKGCGLLLPGLEAQVGTDGNLLLRGDTLLSGYLGDIPRHPDAWFDTGDLAHIDADGSLHVLGRTKDVVIPLSGENINPTTLEHFLSEHPFVADACVFGDGRPAPAALLVLSAAGHGCAAESTDAVERAIADHVARVNAGLPKYARVAGFKLLREPFSIAGGELTTSLKKRRRAIAERRAADIDACYRDRLAETTAARRSRHFPLSDNLETNA